MRTQYVSGTILSSTQRISLSSHRNSIKTIIIFTPERKWRLKVVEYFALRQPVSYTAKNVKPKRSNIRSKTNYYGEGK